MKGDAAAILPAHVTLALLAALRELRASTILCEVLGG
jgi:hypothetical protein